MGARPRRDRRSSSRRPAAAPTSSAPSPAAPPPRPVWAGEISAPNLGVALEAWDADGRPVIGEVGELVVTEPMPSMPLYFWNDPTGERYRDAYFSTYPGVWRHGDWMEVTEHGSVDRLRPLGRHAQPARRPAGQRRHLRRRRQAARGPGLAGGRRRAARRRLLAGRCSCVPADGVELDRRGRRADHDRDQDAGVPAARPRRRHRGRRPAAHPHRQAAGGPRQAAHPGRIPSTRSPARTPSTTTPP